MFAREIENFFERRTSDREVPHTVLCGCGVDEYNYAAHAFTADYREMKIQATSDTFDDNATISPLLKQRNAGFTYQINKDFYVSPELFIDSYVVSQNREERTPCALQEEHQAPNLTPAHKPSNST